jgi:aspartate carbamoyltransferase catalytic subunit
MAGFSLDHVIEAQQFDRALLDEVFACADRMRADLKAPTRQFAKALEGRIMASLFYEPSTRTRFSFESAMARLGGCIITTENAKEFSSASKGESLTDSTRIMNRYADIIVMRHHEPGSAQAAAGVSEVPIINAGDGAGQHPTQALLDLYTIKNMLGAIDKVRIAMVGDLKYGRTVRSLAYLLAKYTDVSIHFIAPPVCAMQDDIKEYLERHNTDWYEEDDLTKVLPQVDCVYMTRIQRERFIVPEEYDQAVGQYVLTQEKVDLLPANAIIMHPLPRVDEIPPEVDDDPRAHYFQQAKNGLFIRMALLFLLLNK